MLAAFACTLGIVPHLIAALTGLAALLHASALAFEIVKYAGVAYLLYMAWQSLREDGALKVEAGADQRTSLRVVIDGVLVNILNPKLSIFFVAFLPQFIFAERAEPAAAHAGTVRRVHGGDLRHLRDLRHVRRRDARRVVGSPTVMAWMRRTFAAAFVMLGARLALTER